VLLVVVRGGIGVEQIVRQLVGDGKPLPVLPMPLVDCDDRVLSPAMQGARDVVGERLLPHFHTVPLGDLLDVDGRSRDPDAGDHAPRVARCPTKSRQD